MKILPLLAAIISVPLLGSCSSAGKPPLPSPDGSLVLATSTESSHADPTAYGCVIVEVRDKLGKVFYRQNTHASDFQRWSVAWISNDEFQLVSSDTGTYTWTRQHDGTWSRR